MPSELIKKHLEDLKSQNKYDDGFIDILKSSNELSEEGETTARKILELIKQRYDKSKENKA